MYKKILTFIIIITLLSILNPVCISLDNNSIDEDIILTFSFNEPVIETQLIDGEIYHTVKMDNLDLCGNPGEPALPAKGVYILIPQGSKPVDVIITPSKKIKIGLNFNIILAGDFNILPNIQNTVDYKNNKNLYQSQDLFPGRLFTNNGVYGCKGYQILVIKLYPIQYIPATGELYYYSDFTVRIKTDDLKNNDFSNYRGLKQDKNDVIRTVTNTFNILSYPELPYTNSDNDLIIITTEELSDSFLPLKNFHDTRGINTLIYSVEDIYSNYFGIDDAKKIRNFIIDKYNNDDIEYVLLGGDFDVVPGRLLTGFQVANVKRHTCASDVYFSNLDGNWNNPENPMPVNKDFSFIDNGVSVSYEGFIGNPKINYTDYEVGSSSMMFSVVREDTNWANVTFIFENPLDLSSVNWINYKFKNIICEDCHDCSESGFEGFCPLYLHRVLLNNSLGEEYDSGGLSDRAEWTDLHNPIANVYQYIDYDFSCIDKITFRIKYFGAWNSNNTPIIGDKILVDGFYFSEYVDKFWGEPGEDDFFSEVFVGRACVDNEQDVNNFISKTIEYIDTQKDDPYLKKVLIAGEELGFDGGLQWAAISLDQLINGCSDGSYSTKGFPEDNYDIEKLYDYFWINFYDKLWPKEEMINRINNNVHIINHLGHGWMNKSLKMLNPDIQLLNNDKPCFIYSQSCLPGAFDNPEGYDSFAEHITVKTDKGAFACIMNSKYGVPNQEGLLDGPSHRYNREFWDAVFGEDIKVISKANQDSKDDNIWRIDEDYMRLVYYELTYFGDPTISFKSYEEVIQKPSTPEGKTNCRPIFKHSYSTSTNHNQGEDVYYQFDWGNGKTSDWLGPYSSEEICKATHRWNRRGKYLIKVKAKDESGSESEWSDYLHVNISWFRFRIFKEFNLFDRLFNCIPYN